MKAAATANGTAETVRRRTKTKAPWASRVSLGGTAGYPTATPPLTDAESQLFDAIHANKEEQLRMALEQVVVTVKLLVHWREVTAFSNPPPLFQGASADSTTTVAEEEQFSAGAMTALMLAVKLHRNRVAKALLESGADVHRKRPHNDATAVIIPTCINYPRPPLQICPARHMRTLPAVHMCPVRQR